MSLHPTVAAAPTEATLTSLSTWTGAATFSPDPVDVAGRAEAMIDPAGPGTPPRVLAPPTSSPATSVPEVGAILMLSAPPRPRSTTPPAGPSSPSCGDPDRLDRPGGRPARGPRPAR